MADNIIFHIDVNSAFLSFEAARRLHEDPNALDLRTVPAVVGGDKESRHGIVLAKSIPTKPYKITTGEPIVSALKKCPSLLIVKPDYRLYVEYSTKLMEYLKSYAPVVEQFSIDEAFLDMTGTRTLYGDPVEFAHKLKDEIKERFGFTVNIGVSENHLLAKMASDFEKPDRVHTLFKDEIKTKMWPLPIEDLFFVGRSQSTAFRSLGINTIGDLANADPALLNAHFKKNGMSAYRHANGEDINLDFDHDADNKSYSNSTTLSSDITSPDIAKQVLLSLTETVAARLRHDNMKITVVSVLIRDTDFNDRSKQTSLYSATNVTDEIYRTICLLFDNLWDHSPIRLLGVAVSKAVETDIYQMNLFDDGRHEKLSRLDSALDKVREKYGDDSVKRAVFLKPRSGKDKS